MNTIQIPPHRGLLYLCGFLLTVPGRVGRIRAKAERRRRARRDSILLDAAAAIRAGRVREADSLLTKHLRRFAGDSAYLNLLGAVFEARGKQNLAGRAYIVAHQVDWDYEPAKRNIRRLRDLAEYGCLGGRAMLGDVQLRMQRTT